MHHLVVKTCLFQRLIVVREFHAQNPRTYTGFYGYSHLCVCLKTNSGPGSG